VLLVLAVLAAIIWIPFPWDLLLVIGAATVEVAEVWFWLWWTRRRRPMVGSETLVGETAVVTTALDPIGYVRVEGELWRARSEHRVAERGRVVIQAVEPDLTLMVSPERD
jgi:membrane protein implicated in regulation of membrane protease activity